MAFFPGTGLARYDFYGIGSDTASTIGACSNPKWERDKVLGRCVLNEAFAFFAVMPAIQGVIGWDLFF